MKHAVLMALTIALTGSLAAAANVTIQWNQWPFGQRSIGSYSKWKMSPDNSHITVPVFNPSDTIACSTCDSIGSRRPAMAATRELLPATAIATFLAAILPRVVSTPATRPSAIEMPVTSQFCTMSTPRWSAARA